MKFRSEKIWFSVLQGPKGFSLPEVVAALTILAFVSTGVLVVINRCMASAADSTLRMHAFEIARDNMEKLLVSDSAQEMIEYGSSYEYPEIQWQTVVETFYEPVSARMWVQAVCSAEYPDAAGETQTVELTHWLTNLTKQEVLKIIDEKRKEKERLAEADQLVGTPEVAAEYAGVDEETVQQWAKDGMPTTEDGEYIKVYLDLYLEYGGSPAPEARQEADGVYAGVGGRIVRAVGPLVGQPGGPLPEGQGEPKKPKPQTPQDDGVKRIHGYTIDELVDMGFPRALLEELYEGLYKR